MYNSGSIGRLVNTRIAPPGRFQDSIPGSKHKVSRRGQHTPGRLYLALAALVILASLAQGAVSVGRVPWTFLSTSAGELPPTNGGEQQTSCVVADIDNDGDVDFFIAERTATPSIILYRRHADGWETYVVDADRLSIEAGGDAADIDGDGDLDLAFGEDSDGGAAWWWENPSPALDPETPWQRRIIKSASVRQQHDQRFGDFDGDGRLEFATWVNRSGRVEIYDIPEDPTVSPWTPLAQIPLSGEGMDVIDMDLDGKVDILAGGAWIRHEEGANFTVHWIDPGYTPVRIVGGQFIPGGLPEVLMNSGDEDGPLNLYWHDGAAWQKNTLIDLVIHGHTLEVGDVDGDGHLDLFAAEMGQPGAGADAKSWIGWGDGAGDFTFEVITTGLGHHMSRLADLDGDGDLDIVAKPYGYNTPRVDVLLNDRPGPSLSLTNWTTHLIDAALPAIALFVEAADIDGDEDLDLVAGAHWWENPGSLSGTWLRHTIGTGFNNLVTIHDFDGDGIPDLLGTEGVGGSPNRTFLWARNDGTGTFTIVSNIDTGGAGDFLQGRLVGTFHGASRQVLLSWHNGGGGLQALTLPADPLTQRWTFQTLTPTTQGEDLSSDDIDGDGDLDLLLGTVWLENTGSSWLARSIGTVADLGTGEPDRNDLADVDGDGDLDAVIALEEGTQVLWFENPRPASSPTNLWTRRLIGLAAGGGFSMDTRDLDGDGDPDVVLGEHRGSGVNRVIIFENHGLPEDWAFHVIDTQLVRNADHHDGTQLVDMDGDGDLDIISIGWTNPKLWLLENTAPALPSAPVIKPTISPSGGAFVGSVQVSLASLTAGAQIRYTLDGTAPNPASLLYSQPFALNATATVKARGFKTGRMPSTVAEASFIIQPDTVAPVLRWASAYGDPNRVVLAFSEALDSFTAQQTGHYTIDPGVTVTAAVLQADLQTVHLETSMLATGIVYNLEVREVQDRAVPPNALVTTQVALVFFETPVSDDFSAGALNESLWQFVNPLDDAQAQLADQALQIFVPSGRSHDIWTAGNDAPRVMQEVQDTDFEIEAKFLSLVQQSYQMQGLLIEQDSGNFLRFDVDSNGSGVFLFSATFLNGSPTVRLNEMITPGAAYWLRVKRTGDLWTCSHSTDGTVWVVAASFTRALNVRHAGVFAANAGANPEFTAVIDYFFNTASPIIPTDPLAPTIITEPADLAVEESTPATFTVVASGAPPLAYQWRRDGSAIPGATNSTYTFVPGSADHSATFSVVIANAHGTATSRQAVLSVAGPVPNNGLILWLRADAGPVLEGSSVTRWVGHSPDARQAISGSVQTRPTLVPNAVHGLPVVRFDGLDDFLIFSLPINGMSGMSIVLVTANHQNQTGGPSQAEHAAIYWRESALWGTVYFSPFQARVNLGFGTTQPGNQVSYIRPTPLTNQFTLTTAIKDGATDFLYVNGQMVLSQGGKFPFLAGCGEVGNLGRGFANKYFAGDIAEVLVYSRALSDGEHQSVHQYLDEKYALTPREPPSSMLRLTPTSRGFLLEFDGLPERSYQLHRATDIRFRIWTILTNSTGGIIEFEDRNPPRTQAFYRVWGP